MLRPGSAQKLVNVGSRPRLLAQVHLRSSTLTVGLLASFGALVSAMTSFVTAAGANSGISVQMQAFPPPTGDACATASYSKSVIVGIAPLPGNVVASLNAVNTKPFQFSTPTAPAMVAVKDTA